MISSLEINGLASRKRCISRGTTRQDVHVLGQTLEVLLLLLELLLELEKLLLLTLADGVVFAGLLAALEGVTRGR